MQLRPTNIEQKNICREGDHWDVVGDVIICRIPGWVTGNAFCVVETQSPPGGGPPMHIHGCEDEIFCVLEGEYELLVGGRRILLGAGDVAYAPRRVPHCYRNVGASRGRLLVTLVPAGFEEFFREVHALAQRSDSGPESLGRLAERYNLKFVTDDSA